MIRTKYRLLTLLLAICAATFFVASLKATPYASNITRSGVAISFILNESTDTLKYSINGGAHVSILDTTKGTKSFNLNSPADTFSIIAEKNADSGYAIRRGLSSSRPIPAAWQFPLRRAV
jgi:hypothetical protein